MICDSPMTLLGTFSGRKFYLAEEGRFIRPGIYFWDGKNNVHVDDAITRPTPEGAAPRDLTGDEERDLYAALSLSGKQGEAVDWPYQRTFNAIAAATTLAAGGIGISVKDFAEAYGSPAPHEALRAALEELRSCATDVRAMAEVTARANSLSPGAESEEGYFVHGDVMFNLGQAVQEADAAREAAALAGERTITIGTREHLAALRYATQGGMFEFDTEKRRLIDEVRALLEMTGPITRGLGITEGGFPVHPVPSGATP